MYLMKQFVRISFFTFCSFLTTGTVSAQELFYQWANSFGGGSTIIPMSIAVNDLGEVYISGAFEDSVDFDPGPGSYKLYGTWGYDAFVAKYSPSGALVWAKNFEQIYPIPTYEAATDIALDEAGNIIISGYYQDAIDFDPGVGVDQHTAAGQNDFFIIKLNPNGEYLWGDSFGGSGYDGVSDISVDQDNNIIVHGLFEYTVDFDPGSGTYLLSATGQDFYVLKLDADGNFVWSSAINASSPGFWLTNSYVHETDQEGNIYIAGEFNDSIDADPGPAEYMLVSSNSLYQDCFVIALNPDGNFIWAISFGGALDESIYGLTIDNDKNVYTTGRFKGTADFDPGSGLYELSVFGHYDSFIQKLDSSGNFIWAISLYGGVNGESGKSIHVSDENMVYVTGTLSDSVDFDGSTGEYYVTSNGSFDCFILKLDSNANLQWVEQIGGISSDSPTEFFVSDNELIYMIGNYGDAVDFDIGSGVSIFSSQSTIDGFVALYAEGFSEVHEEDENNLILFPNPAQTELSFFLTDKASFEIYSMTGKLELRGDAMNGLNTINIGSINSGVYLIVIQLGDQLFVDRFYKL